MDIDWRTRSVVHKCLIEDEMWDRTCQAMDIETSSTPNRMWPYRAWDGGIWHPIDDRQLGNFNEF